MYYQIFHNTDTIIQQLQMYLRYNIQIHTYIQTPLVFMLMWGSLRLAPNTFKHLTLLSQHTCAEIHRVVTRETDKNGDFV